MRLLVKKNHPNAAFKASPHWTRRFFKRCKIVKRRRTKVKALDVKQRLPRIRAFHRGLLRMLSGAGRRADPVWGRIRVEKRANADEVPLAFIDGLGSTFEEKARFA